MEENILFLTPIIVGLVEVAKRIGLPSRYCPLLAVLLGIGISFAYQAVPNYPEMLLGGVMAGLTAVGLFSGARSVIKG